MIFKKIRENKASSIIQILVVIFLLAIIAITFFRIPILHYWKWCFFGAALALILSQCIRLKYPMLLIDRIFANYAGKQIAIALLIFLITLDFAICLFPDYGLRRTFIDFISPRVLLEEATDGFRYEFDTTLYSSNFDQIAIIEEPAQYKSRGHYFKHGFIYFLGIFIFNGLLIATINRFMATRADRYKKGANTYNLSDHFVIIGYGTSCIPIISNLYRRQHFDHTVHFLILTNQDIEAIRREIKTQLQNLEQRVVIYSGDMNSVPHLQRLNITKAKEVFIIGEMQEPSRDSKNLECAKLVKNIRLQHASTETLHVNMQFDKPTSYSTIKRITIPKDFYKDSNGHEVIYLHPFNFFENWARLLWGTHQMEGYRTLDRGIMTENGRHVHLVIAGFNEMGIALLLEAMRVCHYPNYNEQTGANKTQITVIDPNMHRLLPQFRSQYPYLDQIKDINVEFKANRIEDQEIRDIVDRVAQQDGTVLTIAICFPDSDSSMSAALTLPDPVYYHVINGKIIHNNDTEILMRQAIRSGLANLLDEENGKYANIKVFGTLDQGLDDSLLNDNMAIIISAYYHFKYDLSPSQDFFEQVKTDKANAFAEAARNWIALNEDKRFANRYQSEIYKTYQSYRPLLEENPELLYQTEHMRWCAERSITGYRDMHEENIKNETYQLHKFIVPYHYLNDYEKGKDKDVLKIMDKVIDLSQKTLEHII